MLLEHRDFIDVFSRGRRSTLERCMCKNRGRRSTFFVSWNVFFRVCIGTTARSDESCTNHGRAVFLAWCRFCSLLGCVLQFQLCWQCNSIVFSNHRFLLSSLLVSSQIVFQEWLPKVSSKSVSQECLPKVSSKSVSQECLPKVSSKGVSQECLPKVSSKSVSQ